MGVREPFTGTEDPFTGDYDPKLSLILLEDYGRDLMAIAPIYGKRVMREARKLIIYLGMEAER